jgi:hypothetical protein
VRLSAATHAPRALVALVAVAALGALGGMGFVATPASATPGVAATVSGPLYPPRLIVTSEVRLKANLIAQNLGGSPQLVFFGGSRSQRFDPAFAYRRLGLRSVNIALSNARPEAAWAYANWFYKRWPDATLRWVWGVQSTMIRDRDLDPALLQDPRFYGYFPDDLLAGQRKMLPSSVAEMPRYYGFQRNRYSSHGMLLWNVYDSRRAAGYTLDQSLDAYIAKMLHKTRQASFDPTSRASEYLEKTLELLNAHGTTPVIVLMPIHPRVLRVMEQHQMTGDRENLREYLAGLTETYDIKIVDFTRIQSFNGEPGWFYDGVHITRSNSNRVITALEAQAGEYLK